MDEKLRRLQRQRFDPESNERYIQGLIRSGAVENCISQLCDVADYFKHFKDKNEETSAQHQNLVNDVIKCISPTAVYILMRMNDEGDLSPEGVFTTRDAAEKWAADQIMLTVTEWARDDYNLLGDLQELYRQDDYRSIMWQARAEGIPLYITRSDLIE